MHGSCDVEVLGQLSGAISPQNEVSPKMMFAFRYFEGIVRDLCFPCYLYVSCTSTFESTCFIILHVTADPEWDPLEQARSVEGEWKIESHRAVSLST